MKRIFPLILIVICLWISGAMAASGDIPPVPLADGMCLNRARKAFDQGEVLKAARTIESCLDGETTPTHHPYIYFTLGNYYSALADNSGTQGHSPKGKTIRAYRSAVQLAPRFKEAWLNLGSACYAAEDFDQAALAFKTGYDLSAPHQPLYLYHAAVCRFRAGKAKEALALFNALLKNHPGDIKPQWREVMVNILFSMKQYKKALPQVEILAHHAWADNEWKRKKQWQEVLIGQYLTLDMDRKALAFAGELTRQDPLDPKWWKILSQVCLKQHQLERGLSALVIYGYLIPMTPKEKRLTADLYLALGIPEQAARIYEPLARESGDPKALKKLAQVHTMAHHYDSALACVRKALAENPAPKDTKALEQLRKQLIRIKDFYAGADPVLAGEKTSKSKPLPDS